MSDTKEPSEWVLLVRKHFSRETAETVIAFERMLRMWMDREAEPQWLDEVDPQRRWRRIDAARRTYLAELAPIQKALGRMIELEPPVMLWPRGTPLLGKPK